MEHIVIIIAAVVGLVIGAVIVRRLRRTWWGKRLFAAGDRQDEVKSERSEFDFGKKNEQDMIEQDMCYGNMGLGLGPKKSGDD